MTIDGNDKILSIQHQVSVDGYALLMDFVVTFVSMAAFLRFRLQLILGGNHTDRSLIEETGAEPSSAAAEQSRNWSKKKAKTGAAFVLCDSPGAEPVVGAKGGFALCR
jgi:hypothetical protein